jgi:hypothetical protein
MRAAWGAEKVSRLSHFWLGICMKKGDCLIWFAARPTLSEHGHMCACMCSVAGLLGLPNRTTLLSRSHTRARRVPILNAPHTIRRRFRHPQWALFNRVGRRCTSPLRPPHTKEKSGRAERGKTSDWSCCTWKYISFRGAETRRSLSLHRISIKYQTGRDCNFELMQFSDVFGAPFALCALHKFACISRGDDALHISV